VASEVGQYDLEIQQGGTLRRSFQWKDEADAAIDLTGCHVRARIFANDVPNPALTLTDQDDDFTVRVQTGDDKGWFDLVVADEKTDTLLWLAGSWRLDILHPDGTVTPLLKGAVTVNPRNGS
jgi:hypothetical protein